VRCASALHDREIQLRDVAWAARAEPDPFREVRELLGDTIVVRPPQQLLPRLGRKLARTVRGLRDARDLFEAQGVDLFFPIPPCDNAGVPYVFWLPDFQYLRRPDLMTDEMRTRMETYFREHVRAAAQIVLSSEDARSDFARVFPARLRDTHVVRFCSVPDAQWWELDPAEVTRKHALAGKFLIVCNQFTRHKNHLVLMRAMELLRSRGMSDVTLVCTGSTFDHRGEDYAGQVSRFVEEHGLQAQVRILGLLPRAEQIALLRCAAAVMQPSSFEGWSTIIEDAKTLGRPVFASDLPVHAEQLGGAENLLPQDDAGAWANAIAAAWPTLAAGPSEDAEARGRILLEQSMRTCGQAFLRALRSAAPLREAA
jgi:glycosyltransferase involved in cell wall biosynthesis